MRKVQFTVKTEHDPPVLEGNPKALVEAVTILEEKVEDLSKRAEKLLELVASIR